MQSHVVVVIMVDGLRARSLGAYGNTWCPTPSLDHLASQGKLYDRFLAESTNLADVYDGLWSGRHALARSVRPTGGLPQQLNEQGFLCHLLTDEKKVAQRQDAEHFDEVTLVESASARHAAEVFDTSIGRTLEAAANVLGGWSSEYEQPRLLWIHLQGMLAPWDAPIELAANLVDEDDPELTPSLDVPQRKIASDEEGADEVFLASCRYAGQVTALDHCFGAVDDLLSELWPDAPPTVVFGGTRGFALGEHGQLGIAEPAYRELFHVPLLIRGTSIPAMVRDNELTQTSDMVSLLMALAIGEAPKPTGRMIAAGESDESHYLEAGDWQFVTVTDQDRGAELYVAPDDIWQANDVASLCPETVEQFEELGREITQRAATGEMWHQLELANGES